MTYYARHGYSIKSCTTDGFIVEASEMLPANTDFGLFSRMYQTALANLGSDKYFLEVKHEAEGLLTWKTRGQLSEGGEIRAMSGYSNTLPIGELVSRVKGMVLGEIPGRSFTFQQRSLRSGSELLKKGGDLTTNYVERTYSVTADNKRLFDLVRVPGMTSCSNAFVTNEQAGLYKTIGELGKARYSERSPTVSLTGGSKTDSYKQILARQLVRCIFSPEAPEVLGKNPPQKREDIRALLRELGFEGISCNMISKQKACNFLPNSVPKVWVTEIAMARLKEVFPKINENRFWAR